ncbi:MAG: ATP-binding protein [Syntrophobacteraceae bacterium]|nr:ATP-binding protein [Syntrophobacteraceae bacterium]
MRLIWSRRLSKTAGVAELRRDNAASSAILDRLLHRGHLLKSEGKSYRLKEASIRLTENRQKSQDEKGIRMDL